MSEYPSKPEVAVGALVLRDNKVLLVKRNHPPAEDLWAVPGGRINVGETLQEAAVREIKEETGLDIIPGQPIYSFDAIHRDEDGKVKFHYVIIDLLAECKSGTPKAGDDASEVGWFSAVDLNRIQMTEKTKRLVKQYL